MLKKLKVLLAVMLCSMLAIAIPVSLQAAPTEAADQQRQIEHAEDASLLLAEEVNSGEVEAVLILDKSLLTPLFYSLLQHLYPNSLGTSPAPLPCPASKDDCGLHNILTKGP